ncbi:MAG: serine/threonine protein kinase [Myxococcales bacterium]|nr:serine/threonine protein kinase [Myxococcales bacterium]
MSDARVETRAAGRTRIGGRYELLHELASGGMATVYVGRARGAAGFGRLVAIKCCHKHLRSDEDFARMFLDEARLVAELRHPNVVSTLDFGEDEALSLYIVMEFVDGFSVQQLQRMAKHTSVPMPAPVALRIVIDALQGLQAAHDHADPKGKPLHIVHRDVSPQNILLGVDGVARIMDFGIARAESRLTHTRDGNIKGKAAYMAPEQHGLLMDNPPPLTHRADLYSMGVVLWELLVGKRLFQRENDAQTLAAAIRHEYVPASESVPTLPASIDPVIAKAIASNPDDRFADANGFIEAIEGCGLAAGSSRDVSKWVRAVANEQIEKRNAVLRQFAEEDATAEEADEFIDRVLTSATNARLREEIEATGNVPKEALGETIDLRMSGVPESVPAKAPRRRSVALAAGTFAMVLAVGAVYAMTRDSANNTTRASTDELRTAADAGAPARPGASANNAHTINSTVNSQPPIGASSSDAGAAIGPSALGEGAPDAGVRAIRRRPRVFRPRFL